MVPSRVLQRLGRRLREAQELGSYQLVELLGTAAWAKCGAPSIGCWRATRPSSWCGPEVLGARDEAEARLMLRRFEREAQATAALSSPHTIQVFDFGVTEDGTFYYVMELLTGRDLESLVREFGPLPRRSRDLPAAAGVPLAGRCARARPGAPRHQAGQHLCLPHGPRVRLRQGARLRPGEDPGERGAREPQTLATMEHTTTGTPAYMAPEVILGDAEVDRRADVYALGCVAYFLLTGQLVFEADTPMKMLMQHVHAQPMPPSQRTELPIPRELDELVLACLQKDPDKRPQDAERAVSDGLQLPRRARAGTQTRPSAGGETHLPELTGPLTRRTDSATSTGAVVVTV